MTKTFDLMTSADCTALGRDKASELEAQADARAAAGDHFGAASLRRTATYYREEAALSGSAGAYIVRPGESVAEVARRPGTSSALTKALITGERMA